LTLQAKVESGQVGQGLETELAAFWQAKQAEISHLLARTIELGRMLQTKYALSPAPPPAPPPGFVLCHADIHLFNLLVDRVGRLFVVDWDETLLAPKERDLMFVGGPGSGREQGLFYQGYGPAEIDRLALAYYRYEWVIQEIGDFGRRVFSHPELGRDSKAAAVEGFMALFQPGDVVEAAYQADGSD